MALYEYQCEACAHRFEVIQKHSDPPVEKCPVCGKAVHKLQSAPSFQFKGTGWYVTDYARKDGGKSSSDGGSADAGKTKSDTGDKATKTDSADTSSSSAGGSTKSAAPSPSPSSGKES